MKLNMWIFDSDSFDLKDIIEINDFEINIDEETNATSTINNILQTTAVEDDIVCIKKNKEVLYWGIISDIQNENGDDLYTFTLKYITNLFDRDIILENEDLIKTTGVEDFLEYAIKTNFTESDDELLNITWLEIEVVTHTPKQTTVSNVENEIYNFHTWMTNCTQSYDVVYDFSIGDKKLVMSIEVKEEDEQLLDATAQNISNYIETYETDVVAKVTVLIKTETTDEDTEETTVSYSRYNLYLLSDRTTTTDSTDTNRAKGKVVTIYTEDAEEAEQKALDEMKANSYNHNITFDYDEYIKFGTPIMIKTKKKNIYDTYISAIKITPSNYYEYTCGNMRINFIEKIKKERN